MAILSLFDICPLTEMPSEDYTSTPSTGKLKLKLKGVKDSRITKKRKNKTSKDEKSSADVVEDNSVILKKLEEEDREIRRAEKKRKEKSEELMDDDAEDPELGVRVKTEAERKYDEQRRKRVCLSLSIPPHLHNAGLAHPLLL